MEADGDCEYRISVLGILANVLIDKTCPFQAFAKRIRESAKAYAAKEPRFAPKAQIEKAFAAIQEMQGKSLKEILVWMNNAAIDHLLIEGFYRPMKGAQMFVYSRNSLSKILDLVNIEDKYQDPNSTLTKP